MAHQVPWNETIYSEFSKLAMLSPFEREILRMRIMGYGIVKTALELQVSESTVSRTVAMLKKKYDKVQPLSEKLPKRKMSAQETWMDRN